MLNRLISSMNKDYISNILYMTYSEGIRNKNLNA
jgi:hypothetical protein